MDKILIAEDDLKLQKFLQARLKKYQNEFEVILASNGEEAAKVLQQKHIALLITDIEMPKYDGMKLLSYINNKFPHIPCIVMSAHMPTGLVEKLSDDNLLRLFQKPFQLDELTQAIRQALEKEVPDGTLKGISVASFLQMIQLEDKTCLFEVTRRERARGFLFQGRYPIRCALRQP
jgi:DNA-binding NtrC family response regulator